MYASRGNDVLLGCRGLGADRGLDELSSGASRHRVRVDMAAHLARVGAEHDKVSGFEIVRGGAGSDVIVGTNGFEELLGGHGNDIIKGRGGTGPDFRATVERYTGCEHVTRSA